MTKPASLWRAEPGIKHLPPALLNRWRNELRKRKAPDAPLRALADLENPETMVVVTGQQPGIWGGALYGLYKAATAVSLARRIAKQTGRPAVAIFWVQGDDTDWGEVGWGALPRKDLSLFRHRWNPSPVPSRHWIGGAKISAPDGLGEALEDGGGGPIPGGPDNATPVELARSYVDFLSAYFEEAGLVALDSRWPEVRRGGHDLWVRYLDLHQEVAESVRARGEQIRTQGGDAPIADDASDHGLFPLEGEARLPIDRNRWEAQVRDRLERGEAERLAPSVLLRAALQDHLFGTVAHVVGRAEAGYLQQLAPVYEALGVPAPVRVPRMKATVVPGGLLPQEGARDVVTDPEAWIAGRARGEEAPAARDALTTLRRGIEMQLTAYVEASGRSELEQAAESARRKMLAQVDRLDEALDRWNRRALYRNEPMLRHLAEFLKPQRGDQERGLSGASVDAYFGADAAPTLLAAADLHLQHLQGGEMHHFVLEGSRV